MRYLWSFIACLSVVASCGVLSQRMANLAVTQGVSANAPEIIDGNFLTWAYIREAQVMLPEPRSISKVIVYSEPYARIVSLSILDPTDVAGWKPVAVPLNEGHGPKMTIPIPVSRKTTGVSITFRKIETATDEPGRRRTQANVPAKIRELELWGLDDSPSNDSTEDHMERDLIERMMKDLNRPSP